MTSWGGRPPWSYPCDSVTRRRWRPSLSAKTQVRVRTHARDARTPWKKGLTGVGLPKGDPGWAGTPETEPSTLYPDPVGAIKTSGQSPSAMVRCQVKGRDDSPKAATRRSWKSGHREPAAAWRFVGNLSVLGVVCDKRRKDEVAIHDDGIGTGGEPPANRLISQAEDKHPLAEIPPLTLT